MSKLLSGLALLIAITLVLAVLAAGALVDGLRRLLDAVPTS